MTDTAPTNRGWWSQLDPYQRLVFSIATMAWLFDCLDQQLFNLARSPALDALLTPEQFENKGFFMGLTTSIFIFGWATGGMIMGSLGDRFGRVRILSVAILMYSLATGLSALSTSIWDFSAYRFITGLGVGGVFGLAVALVADTTPNHVRPRALGILQAFSAFGNVGAALLGLGLAMTAIGMSAGHWKWLFLIGAAPAFLVALLELRVKEPPAWVEARDRAKEEGKTSGSYRELFGTPTWRRNALFGMLLACAGVVGLWGIGVFSNDLVGDVILSNLTREGVAAESIQKSQQFWRSINLLLFNVGAYFGMITFTRLADVMSRKRSFAIFFTGALLVTVFVFQFIGKFQGHWDIIWMTPVMGFFQLSVFAGFSIYLPELFPTRLRATGVSFCYNAGRYLSGLGPLLMGGLIALLAAPAIENARQMGVDPSVAKIDAFRNAASWMSLIFLLGLVVLPFLPETKDKPLPE